MISQNENIGPYNVIREISVSDIAIVYLARDPRLNREVVIKLILPDRELSEEFQENFRLASRDLAQLSHANIIKVLDFGEHHGAPYVVMEYIPGGSLQDRIGTVMSWQEAANIIIPVANALAYTHHQNLIHRDLKPTNILFSEDGKPIITDLNFVSLIEDEETRDFTSTTIGLGKPEYMSPEQGKGLVLDHRADIYSLGIIFYELVTGRKPFESDNPMDIVIDQVMTPVPDPRKFCPTLPVEIVHIIMKMLTKDPEFRYDNMSLVVENLNKVMQRFSSRSFFWRHRRIITGVVIALSVFLVTTIIWYGQKYLVFDKKTDLIQQTRTPTLPISQTVFPTPTELVLSQATTSPNQENEISTETDPAYWDEPPYLPGKSVVVPDDSISNENIDRLVELARWGNPKINDIAWYPDGSKLIAATSNGVYFLSAENLKMLGFLDLQAWINVVAISSDGKYIALGSSNNNVYVIEFSTGNIEFVLREHMDEVISIAFSSDSKMLISGSKDNSAIIWDINSGTSKYSLKGHILPVTSVCFSSDNKFAYTGSEDFRIMSWDVNSGGQIQSLSGPSQVNSLSVSSNNKFLATALQNASIEIWNLETGKLDHVIKDKDIVNPINVVSYSPSGFLLLSGSDDGNFIIWQSSTGAQFMNELISSKSSNRILDLEFSPDGSKFIALTESGLIDMWSVIGRKERLESEQYEWAAFSRISLSSDNRFVAVQDENDMVSVYDVQNGDRKLSAYGELARGNPFSINSKRVVLLRSIDKYAIYYVYNVDSGKNVFHQQGYELDGVVNFLPNDNNLGISFNNKLNILSLSNGKEISEYQSDLSGYCQIVYDENGEMLYAGSKLGLFTNEDMVDRFCEIPFDKKNVDEDYLPSGEMIGFAQGNQATLWILSPESVQNKTFKNPNGDITAIAISPDGSVIASIGSDQRILFWDPNDITDPIYYLEHGTALLSDLTFSSDGKYLLTSSIDGSIQIWGIYP